MASDDEDQQSVSAGKEAFARLGKRLKFDEESLKKFTKVFAGFSSELEKTNKQMKGLVQSTREFSATVSGIKMPELGMGGGGGKTPAGGVPSNGNFLKTGMAYGAMKVLGASGMGAAALGAAAVGKVHEAGKAAWGYAGNRIQENAGGVLTADRTGLLMRQMYGGTQLDYQSRWRQPLTGGLIGKGGVEQMMKLQTTMGINPTSMLKDVEAIRVASGFGYTTEDATKMITAMASPGSSNLMTMMMGKGFWGPGGEARGVMPLANNIINRMNLDSTERITGALQSGSMTRANLSRMGLPEDMQDMVLQLAQQNVQFKEMGGSGSYDPSNESHRKLMGINDAYAMEEQRTRMSEVERGESFYRKQVDNYAQLEKNTQGLIEKFQQLDEALSPIIGLSADLKNKWWLRLAGKVPGFGGLGKLSGATGDTEHLRDAGMNSGFASSLQKMKSAADSAGVPLSLTSGTRDSAKQEMLFRSRHSPVGDVEWAGQSWRLNPGASPAAPPGGSLHELGYAADLGPPSSYDWITANAGKFGLRHGKSFGEPWHVAPANITSASQVTGKRATSVATPRPTASGSNTWLQHLASLSDAGRGAWATKLGLPRDPATRGMSTGSTPYTSYRSSGAIQAVDPATRGMGDGGQGSSVVISPTINLNGSGNTAADADMLANRIIRMIETSEAVRTLRRS
jgi:LAS superfamily LD-carboxypeptidase LdcB